MKSNQHNYMLFDKSKRNCLISANSHSISYNYLSAILLYLKSHFPPEFYTAILRHEKDAEKIRDYRGDAALHGVLMNKLDLNLSKENFSLVDNTIYIGFSNIKGIGKKVAERIVEHQPYTDIQDFLDRFGTEADIIKPLVGLRVFPGNPAKLYYYYEYYKKHKKKITDSQEELISNKIKYGKQISDVLGESINLEAFNPEDFRALDKMDVYHEEVEEECTKELAETERGAEIPDLDNPGEKIYVKSYYRKVFVDVKKNKFKDMMVIFNRYQKSKTRREEIIAAGVKSWKDFTAEDVRQFPDNEKIKEVVTKLADLSSCENDFYGFQWVHELERSPDYLADYTFAEIVNSNTTGAVNLKILKVEKRKGPKSEYWQLTAEDVNCEQGRINVWKSDYEKFSNELKVGMLIRMRISPPTGGYSTYTIASENYASNKPRWLHKAIPKKDDYRLVVLRPGENYGG